MSLKQESRTDHPQPQLQRLQKVLAAAGIGSRRHCEEYILAGRVSVDGKTVQDLGTKVDPQEQKIQLDGESIRPQRKRYFILNKPAGYLCTNNDPAGRQRVIDLFPEKEGRLFTVGRLDENSEGLIIVTNDGELANRLAHPRFRIPRTYHIQVAGKPTRETFIQLREGVYFSEGKFRVDRARRLRTKGKSTFLEVELRQGRNREIRRLMARVGHKVMHLQRVAFGSLKLGRLSLGQYRPLKSLELKQLHQLADGLKKKTPASRKKPTQGKGRKKKTSKPRPSSKQSSPSKKQITKKQTKRRILTTSRKN